MQQMGARSAGNLHAACDVEGAGNVAWPKCVGQTGAPVLDPTDERGRETGSCATPAPFLDSTTRSGQGGEPGHHRTFQWCVHQIGRLPDEIRGTREWRLSASRNASPSGRTSTLRSASLKFSLRRVV